MPKIKWIIFALFVFLSIYTILFGFDKQHKILFEKKCNSCHPSRLPLSKNKSIDEWSSTIIRMRIKMQFLNNTEAEQIIAYLAEVSSLKDDQEGDQHEMKIIEMSFEQGKKMFSDIRLGRNGKSCVSCHNEKENALFKKAFLYPKYFKKIGKIINLEQRINYCIMTQMEGEALRLGSDEVISMTMYLYSLL